MHSLKHICEKTEKEFKEFYSGLKPGVLEKVAEDWINGNEQIQIMGYTIKPGDKLVIAVKNKPVPNKPEFDKYYILRFFPGGKEGWNVSQDLQAVDEEKFIHFLLNKMK